MFRMPGDSDSNDQDVAHKKDMPVRHPKLEQEEPAKAEPLDIPNTIPDYLLDDDEDEFKKESKDKPDTPVNIKPDKKESSLSHRGRTPRMDIFGENGPPSPDEL